MFKLVVLSTLLAIAAAKPSGVGLVNSALYAEAAPVVKTALISEPGHIEVKEPVIAKVGDVVHSVPTAVSHQSSTVVHSKANLVTPIVAPAVKTYTAPVVNTYAAPIVSYEYAGAPVLKSYAHAPYISAPLTAYAGVSPILRSYSAPILKSYSSPLVW